MALSADLVIWLMAQGHRQTDIAKEYGVSRQYVHKLAKNGGYVPPITTITENLPWEVDSSCFRNTIYISLRAYGHINLGGPESLEKDTVRRAETLVRRLKVFNQVIDYDPEYPPIPGLSNVNGFAYVPRTEADEDYVIKIRPGVKITPLGEKLWRMPQE